MLVFAAAVPHSPLLIPTIGRENLERLQKTAEALERLKNDFAAARPETVIIISPHGSIIPDAFTINLSPAYAADFQKFGDFNTTVAAKSDFLLIDRLQRRLRQNNLPTALTSEEKIDHGVAVPFWLLATGAPNLMLVPIFPCGLPLAAHFTFGQTLKSELLASNKRMALIASTCLAHTLSPEAPGGFSPRAADFDNAVIAALKNNRHDEILALPDELRTEVKECGLRPLVMALGALNDMNVSPEILSYESPFGVGLPVVNFKLG